MAGLNVLVWLARGEGTQHVIAEAGAARLPVGGPPDNSVTEQVLDGASGLLVPYQDPPTVAARLKSLLADPALRQPHRTGDHRSYASACDVR